MEILSGFADVSMAQLALVAAVAFFASLIGGVSGHGTALMSFGAGAADRDAGLRAFKDS